MPSCLRAVLLFATLAPLTSCSKPVPSSELLSAAKQALRKSDTSSVKKLVEQIPRSADEWQAGRLLAGEAAFKEGRPEEALDYYLSAAERNETTPDGQLALFSAAELHLEWGRLSQAEPLYQRILNLQPKNGLTNQRMAFLLGITGRRWESLDHYFVLIKGGDANFGELALAADVGRHLEEAEFLKRSLERSPHDPLSRLAWAAHAFNEGRPEARELLESLVESFPDFISSQAMLGELLVDAGDDRRILSWHQALPASADHSPDIWFVRGLWARKKSELRTAAECFWQSVVRMPFHRRAFYLLGQTLVALGDPDAGEITRYSERLIALSQSIDQVLISEGRREKAMRRTAELLEELGRIWEMCAWGVVARARFPHADWPNELLRRHSPKLNEQFARIEPDKNPVGNRQLAAVPQLDRLLAKAAEESGEGKAGPATELSQEAGIHFEEAPVILFQYHNADDPQTKGVRTFEQTGGGVAILDYDMDGVPDVFLPQGSDWKTGETAPTPSPQYRDKLFRNHAGREFEDVSDYLIGPDSGYGQGCAVGDFNNDGFPDLYVANIGRNCLYENMGDGTFVSVTETSGLRDESWTASALFCDLNADGLPDIFDVNYLTGEGLYTKICQGRACSPSVFPGARDRLLINQSDGRFVEAADATPDVDSKGLGIVAFEMQPNRRPVLFIANDQVANYFLSNEPADNAYNIRLSDDALINGLAFNEAGLPMACMGIAIDDWDNNGLIDLFVTNFHNESNTLYRQDFPGLFIDATKGSGLYAESIPMTGWGTQSLDADLDGLPDLVITNGHVDDYRDEGGEYHMRPQFFRNLGGRFEELTDSQLGPWFGKKYLGRGLARVDWNLDGLPDFIVSNMNAPVSVLKNTSTNTGRFLRFRLHATQTARDAIGSRVTLKVAGREVTRQLVAGDGYMASNERVVEFGLGDAEQVDEVAIRWPSGATSRLKSPPIDATWIIVEGLNLATGCHGSGPASFPVMVEMKAKP